MYRMRSKEFRLQGNTFLVIEQEYFSNGKSYSIVDMTVSGDGGFPLLGVFK